MIGPSDTFFNGGKWNDSNGRNKKRATAFHEIVVHLCLGGLWRSRKREEHNEERMGSIEAICFGNKGELEV